MTIIIAIGRRPIEEAAAKKAVAIRASLERKIGMRRIARGLGVVVGTVTCIRESASGTSR